MPRKEDYESGKPFMDLKDYSGEFIRGLRYEDFSKETLAKMYNAAGKLILLMDKCWQDLTAEKYGWDEAVASEIEVWTKRLSAPIPAIMHDALGITGQNDVQALMKHNQFDATWPYPLFECDYDMPDKEHGIITCYKCSAVDYWERHGKIQNLLDICYKMEPEAFENYCRTLNPNITSRALKRPPRKDKNDICCQWEITYVDNAKKEWGEDWADRSKYEVMPKID